jgi:hypothetical protein
MLTRVAAFILAGLSAWPSAVYADEQAARHRLDEDAAAGRPLVAHVIVALADNKNQGLVPVPAAIGDGQKPATNLYWGAGYGVWWFFGKKAGWKEVPQTSTAPPAVLQRVVFRKMLRRGGKSVTAYVVADAYDGARIREAVVDELEHAAGRKEERVVIHEPTGDVSISAGGAASVAAYVGHDGLMDFTVAAPAAGTAEPSRSAMVLACESGQFFGPMLESIPAHRLLLTTGLMAPEAYTLDAALTRWFEGGASQETREAAASTYDRYQHCGLRGARRLFGATER